MQNLPYKRRVLMLVATAMAATASWAQLDVTQPGDVIFASSPNSPGTEGASNAIDGKTTKYLNFDSGRDGNQIGTFSPSGFAVTPAAGVTRVTGLAMQSANDDDRRDPNIIRLEGSNDNSLTNFTLGNWQLITVISNAAAGFTSRFQNQTFSFANERPYKHYRWTVEEVRDNANGCCMQIAEVELLGTVVPDDVTQPGDVVIASTPNSPGTEGGANAIDNKTTKYLNFDSGRDGNQIGTFSPSGFVVTPGIGRSLITGITMQSANDDDRRDPNIITLEGSNDETITAFSAGNWELIKRIEGVAAGFTARFQEQTFLFDNFKPYTHYRWTVNEVRDNANGCCMQVAEVKLHGTSEPQDVTQPGDVIFASSPNSPGTEGGANAIDNKTTKYLNFDSGRDGNQIGTFSPSGFAVSPSIGASTVLGMTIQSANDDDRRDPNIVTLEGSNDETLTGYSTGTWEPITVLSNIAAGFTARFQEQEFFFPNTKPYKHYRWTVNEVRDNANGCCMQVAEVELLAATSIAPPTARFVSQPVNTPVLEGQPATFYAALNGPWPVQWMINGTNIPGATRTTFTTEAITAANATNVYTLQIVGRETSGEVQAILFTPSASKSIGISFMGEALGGIGANGAPTLVDTNDVMGLFPQAYWNNAASATGDLPGQTDVDGNPIPFRNSTGEEETAITFNFTASGVWGAGTGVDAPTDQLLNGLTTDAPGGEPATYTFSGVPAGSHTLLAYVVNPPLQFNDMNYKVTGTAEQTYYIRGMNSDEYNAAPGWYRGSSTSPTARTTANLVRFENVQPLDGVITLAVDTITTGTDIRSGLNAIQLILNAPSAGAPPAITVGPQPTVVAADGTARLTVTATGANLTYQWRKNGRNIPDGGNISGATTPSLAISGFTEDDEGIYSVAVFSPAGSALSKGASVRISSFDINEELAAYLKFDATTGSGAPNSVTGGQAGTIFGQTAWGAGKTANALTFDGFSTYLVISNYAKAQDQLAVSTWVNVDPATGTAVSLIRNAQGGLAVGGANSGQFELSLVPDVDTGAMHLRAEISAGPNLVRASSPQPFTLGTWQHVAVSADGAQLRLFVNGQEVASTDYQGNLIVPNTQYLSVGARLARDVDSGELVVDPAAPNMLFGQIDDLAVFNRAFTAQEVGLIYAAGNQGQALSTVVIQPPQGEADIEITRSATGLTINYSGGVLQGAPSVTGPYAPVTGASSPHPVNTSAATMQFYRVLAQ